MEYILVKVREKSSKHEKIEETIEKIMSWIQTEKQPLLLIQLMASPEPHPEQAHNLTINSPSDVCVLYRDCCVPNVF
jgi:hypothetical protein